MAAPAVRTSPHATTPAQADAAPERPAAEPEAPAHLQAAVPAEPKPEVPRPLTARDIKLEVAGGESRVELRLTERAGEVKVAVRTADSGLSSSLRDNLPELTSKLAGSGFKTDPWRPSASPAEAARHVAESAAGNTSQDADPQSRQQDPQSQQDSGQRRPKPSPQFISNNQKGRDFAWLMSTLR